MPVILHLSDLHFGEELLPPNNQLLNSPDGATTLAQHIHKQVTQRDEDDFGQISCVLVTGDLTASAEPAEFGYAEIFLKQLCTLLDLPLTSLLVVPGNHDVSWRAAHLKEGAKFAAFGSSYKTLFGRDWKPNEPSVVRLQEPTVDMEFIIFGFNSCSVEKEIWSGLGFIDERAFAWVESWLKDNARNAPMIKMAALHHHVLPVHNYYPSFRSFDPVKELTEKNRPPVSLLLNASKLLKVCRKHEIAAIFHGHAHAPYSVIQRNYLDDDSIKDGEHVVRSVAILGCGSPTSGRLENYLKNHYQVVRINGRESAPIFQIWPFRKSDYEPNIEEMRAAKPFEIPGGSRVIESHWGTYRLRERLNRILMEDTALRTGDDRIYAKKNIYDSLLHEVMSWISYHSNKDFGNVVVAKFMQDLGVYKHIAIYRYTENVRHVAYSLDEESITTTCARDKEPKLVPSRNKCPFASRSRDRIYRATLGGDDQSCMYIPLNYTKSVYPYAVLGFARPRYGKQNEYTHNDLTLIESVIEIIEDAFRQADLVEIAEKRRQLLLLFSWLKSYVANTKETDLGQCLTVICERVFRHMGFEVEHGDKIAMFLPRPPELKCAYCVAEYGFGPDKAKGMIYKIGGNVGLTGGVIDSGLDDYCFDHLNPKNKSFRQRTTSGKCETKAPPMIDHHLSFVGVPVGDIAGKPMRGALVLNIATPIGSGRPNYMEDFYVEPLRIIASLMMPLIDSSWHGYCAGFPQ